MFNKNLIIGIVAMVLLGGGIAIYFLNGNKTTTVSTPIARKGELTRELAKQLIWEEIKDKPETLSALYFEYNGGYSSDGIGTSVELKELSDRGLINIASEHTLPQIFTFTEKGKEYTSPSRYAGSPDSKSVDIRLADFKIKDITITGITKAGETKALVYFDVERDYTYTPFGEVLSEKKPSKESSKMPSQFTLYDDGWRIGL